MIPFNEVKALKLIQDGLTTCPYLEGVDIAFGEELSDANSGTPVITWWPTGGSFVRGGPTSQPPPPGPTKPTTPPRGNPKVIWTMAEELRFELHAFDKTPSAGPLEHATAVEALRQRLIAALEFIQWGRLVYEVRRGTWQTSQDDVKRQGRGYVLLIAILIPVTMPEDVEVTVNDTTFTLVPS